MWKHFVDPRTFRQDAIAGLVLGIQSIPDGLAQGMVALVNPIYGLYGYMVGTFTAAFFTSSAFMTVQATGAMSLVVASVPQIQDPERGSHYLFALAIVTGIIMLTAGLLKLGSLTRFVPHSVMIGFVNAVALLIILSQLGGFTGISASGANRVTQTFNLLRNLDQGDLPTFMVGIATILLILTLEKTRIGALGLVVALVVASMLVPLFGWNTVQRLNDIAEIPRGLPRPVFPALITFPAVIIPAFSLAFVGLVQGAGITKSYANPDGRFPDASGDFVGQGLANIASGLFQGMPVGGSFSATSLVVNAGAKSRTANIVAGIVIALGIVFFSRLVGLVAMPSIAGLLIVVGFRSFKPHQIEMVWRTGPVQQLVMGITFLACLLVPLQYAVLLGVALSLLLFVIRQSNRITLKVWKRTDRVLPRELDPPATLPANEVVMLVPYGSLFFATAPLFEGQLPEITDETRHTVVVLNLRSNTDLGSTFYQVVERYAWNLQQHESLLMLAGVNAEVVVQLRDTGLLTTLGRENVWIESEFIGESAMMAWEAADNWVAEQAPPAGETPPEEAQPVRETEAPDEPQNSSEAET